jgi:hypothetical protein
MNYSIACKEAENTQKQIFFTQRTQNEKTPRTQNVEK